MNAYGKYVRHAIAGVVGSAFSALAAYLLVQYGIEVSPDALAGATVFVVEIVTGLTLLLGYSFSEKYLKRFASLDPEGALDRILLKEGVETAEQINAAQRLDDDIYFDEI